MMGGHTFAMELGGRLLANKYRFNITYQKKNNRLMDMIVYRSRTQAYQQVLERMDMRTMIRSLKQGEGLWYAPDQDFGRRLSVLGIRRITATPLYFKAENWRLDMTEISIYPTYMIQHPRISG